MLAGNIIAFNGTFVEVFDTIMTKVLEYKISIGEMDSINFDTKPSFLDTLEIAQPLLKRLDRPAMGRQHPQPSAGQCQELDR